MTRDELHLLSIVPEMIVVDLTKLALDALLRALEAHHPAIHAAPKPTDAPLHNAARDILAPLASLHHALRRYRHAAEHVAREFCRDDLPF